MASNGPTSTRPKQTPLPPWGSVPTVFSASFILSVLLYWPVLTAFFIFDDLPHLSRCSPGLGHTLLDCWKPWGNGFWRPLNGLAFYTTEWAFGRTPLAFHLLCLAIHAAVSTLTFLVGRRLLGFDAPRGALAALLVTIHFGATGACIQLSNTCDSLLALFTLVTLLSWEGWLGTGGAWALARLVLAGVFCFLSKESAVALPLVLGLWSWGRPQTPGRTWAGLAGFLATSVIAAGIVIGVQLHGKGSYGADGRVSFSPVALGEKLADYTSALLVPYLQVGAWPWFEWHMGGAAQVAIRLAMLGAIAIAVVCFLRNRRHSSAGMLLMAVVMLLPSVPVQDPVQARYLYPAIPFLCLGLVFALRTTDPPPPWARRTASILVAALATMWGLGFPGSPLLRNHAGIALRVQDVVTMAEWEAPHWREGEVVTLLNHPHPGPAGGRWVYCQLLFDVFVPEPHVWVSLDHFVPGRTRHAYDCGGGMMRPVPIPTGSPPPKPTGS